MRQLLERADDTEMALAGEQHELLTAPPQTQYRDFSVDIETTKTGANGTSQYSITLEWYSN